MHMNAKRSRGLRTHVQRAGARHRRCLATPWLRRACVPVMVGVGVLLGVGGVASASAATSFSVPGDANLYAAGSSTPPDPASFGQGAGVLPIAIPIPANTAAVSLSGVTGTVSVNDNGGCPYVGADGDPPPGCANSGLRVNAYGGISGITSDSNGFLTGVFLAGSGAPSSPPTSLDFSASGLGSSFATLAPDQAQTFFVGDGLTATGDGQTQCFLVPAGATDLYLGYADAPGFGGSPGAYGDNNGSISGNVNFSTSTDCLTPNLNDVESSQLDYTSGSGPSPVTSSLTIDSPAALTSATVTITSGHAGGEDVLALPPQSSGITASWNDSKGQLTLSGTAPVAAYQAALRAVTYEDPEPLNAQAGARTISFQVIGATTPSNIVNRTINVHSCQTTHVTTDPGSQGLFSWANNLSSFQLRCGSVFSGPDGVSVAHDGTVLIADTANDQVKRVSPDGSQDLMTYATGAGTHPRQAVELSSGSTDNVVASDAWSAGLATFSFAGSPLSSNSTGSGSIPRGVAAGPAGIAVADAGTSQIKIFDINSNLVRGFGSAGSAPGELQQPEGVAFDTHNPNLLWVADTSNNRVEQFDVNGNYTGVTWGTPGTAAGELNHPTGIAVDNFDNIWIADWGNNRVEEFTNTGHLLAYFTQAGTTGALYQPVTVALDPGNGDLYVADTGNNRVVRYTIPGPVAHTGSATTVSTATVTLGGTVDTQDGPWTCHFEVVQIVAGQPTATPTQSGATACANGNWSPSATVSYPGSGYSFRLVASRRDGSHTSTGAWVAIPAPSSTGSTGGGGTGGSGGSTGSSGGTSSPPAPTPPKHALGFVNACYPKPDPGLYSTGAGSGLLWLMNALLSTGPGSTTAHFHVFGPGANYDTHEKYLTVSNYGYAQVYAAETVGAVSAPSAALWWDGLRYNTTYSYYAVATDSNHGVSTVRQGPTCHFTTPPAPDTDGGDDDRHPDNDADDANPNDNGRPASPRPIGNPRGNPNNTGGNVPVPNNNSTVGVHVVVGPCDQPPYDGFPTQIACLLGAEVTRAVDASAKRKAMTPAVVTMVKRHVRKGRLHYVIRWNAATRKQIKVLLRGRPYVWAVTTVLVSPPSGKPTLYRAHFKIRP